MSWIDDRWYTSTLDGILIYCEICISLPTCKQVTWRDGPQSPTRITTLVRPERAQCEQAVGWTRCFPAVYILAAGRSICVRTDRGCVSMLVIEKPATNTTAILGFHYFTWN